MYNMYIIVIYWQIAIQINRTIFISQYLWNHHFPKSSETVSTFKIIFVLNVVWK